MTISYQRDVASSTAGGFTRLLFKWKVIVLPLNFILSLALPQPYLADSVRRLRGVKDKMESRDSSSWPVSFLLLVVQAMRLLQSESVVFWQQERGQAGRGLCLLCPYSPPSHNSFQWTGHSSTHHPTALKPKCTP